MIRRSWSRQKTGYKKSIQPEYICKLLNSFVLCILSLIKLSQKRKYENLESEPEGSKKRKKDNHCSSPAKRVRPPNQELSRVKEFPAGNVATSFARTAFLRSLCKIPKFREMVDMVPTLVRIQLFRTIVDILFYSYFSPRLLLFLTISPLGLLGKARTSFYLQASIIWVPLTRTYRLPKKVSKTIISSLARLTLHCCW